MSAKKAQIKKSGAKQNKVLKPNGPNKTVPKKPNKQTNSAKAKATKSKPTAPPAKNSKINPPKKAALEIKNSAKANSGGENPAKHNNPGTPGYIVALKRKIHREIFDKCVEKKMLQEFDFWES
jgi:hypothetical protein